MAMGRKASSRSGLSGAVTMAADFREEFAAQTDELLHRRLIWLTGIIGLLGLLIWAAWLGRALGGDAPARSLLLPGVFATASVLVYVSCFMAALRSRAKRDVLFSIAFWLVVFDGVLQIVLNRLGVEPSLGMAGVMVTHMIACLFIPWTPVQAMRPLGATLTVYALVRLLAVPIHREPMGDAITAVLLSPAVGIPGTLICWFRHSRRLERFKLQFLHRRYAEIRQELFNARQIHESLFPKVIEGGPLRLTYRYEPMRQIGGDFLHAHTTAHGEDRVVSVVVMDVTGHGIAAALTVNRLHGELERLFAEHPEIRPGEVLRLLNRYVHLTLAIHSVYVTAFCARVDTRSPVVEYASGGHPPAFIRGVDGTIHELESTTIVLGATRDADFEASGASAPFGPGDSLVVYTDGAYEARDAGGRMLGITGLRRILAGSKADPSSGWPGTILAVVDAHRTGQSTDDVLIVEISRMLDSAPVSWGAPREGARA